METRQRKFSIVLLANFFFFLNFSQLILLPKFIIHLGFSTMDIGLVMGVFNIAVICTLPLVGLLSSTLTRKALFFLGSLVVVLSTYLFIYVDRVGIWMYSLRIAQGIGFALAFGISGAMVFDTVIGARRRRYLGLLTASNMVTHAIGPSVGEYMIACYGFVYYFLSASIFGLIGAVIALGLPSIKDRGYLIHHRLNPRSVAPFMAGSALLGVIFGSTVVFLPPYLMTVGIENSSLFFITFVSGGFIVWVFLYRFFKNTSRLVLYAASILMIMILPLMVSFIRGNRSLVCLALLFGIGYGYLYPTLNGLTMSILPRTKGLANVLFVWAFNLGMALALFAFGIMTSMYGYKKSFFVVGLSGLLLFVLMVFLGRHRTTSDYC